MAKAKPKRSSLKLTGRARKKRVSLRAGALSKKHRSSKRSRGIEETNYLLRSPANARRLLESIKAANAGKLQEHELAE